MAKTKIHGEYLDPSVISGQTQVTAVGADSMLVFDATDNALKKALLSDLIETVGATPNFTSISIGGTEVINSSRNALNLTNLVVDNLDFGGSALTVASGDFTIDVAGDIVLDADGGDFTFKDGGTTQFQLQNSSGDVQFVNNTQDKDVKFMGDDGGSTITALTLDMSDAGKATFNGGIVSTQPNVFGACSFNEADLTDVGTVFADQYLGDADTNTGIVLNGSDVMTLHTAGTERMRITNAGVVGIGTNAPVIASGSAGLVIHSTTGGTGNTGASRLRFTNTTTGQASTDGVELSLDGNTSDFYIENREGEDIIFWSGQERGRWRNGGGLCFNGDTAAANALDDYEEGTFTPLFYGSSSGTAENSSSGYYTKIGRLVTLHVDVYNKAFGTYSGALRMQLPFTNAGTNIPSSAGDIYFYPSGNWDGVSNFAGIGVSCYNTSYLNFSLIQLDSDRQTSIGSSNTNTSNSSGNFLRFSFTYVAA